MSKKKLTIAVTALNAIDSPGPGVAVIRSIRECPGLDVRIVGLAYESLEPGLYMHDLVDKTYQVPYPSGGTEPLLARLMDIHKKDPIDLIIPNFDAELFNFIKIRKNLADAGIRTFLPELEQLESRDKLHLAEFGKKHGFRIPEEKYFYEFKELRNQESELKYPLVVKGKYYDATVVTSIDEAEKAFRKIQARWGLPIILQEFIQGTEINIAALGDGEGQAISVIPMRKLYITEKGKAWAGVTLDDENLLELGRRFVRETHWRGGCELEVMVNAQGEPYILEINPRFPAWIYLTAAAGQNQPASLVKMAMGEKVEPMVEYEVGKIFIRYSWELITDIQEFQRISALGEL